jgi:hypothetical protein
MATVTSHPQLEKIGRTLVRWQSQLTLTRCLAALLGVLAVLGLADLWLQLDRPDRFITGGLLLALALATIVLVRKASRKRYTPEGVAADIEKSFPELDNHLINHLQLAHNPEGDSFKKAYVKEGAPQWQNLDFRKMRDQDAHRRSRIALALILAVLLIPALFVGQAWPVALWRAANPFSSLQPVHFTNIIDVLPGDSTVLQGQSLILTCNVEGRKGHQVRVDVDPGDADQTTYSLGKIGGPEQEEFSHRLPKVATGLRYRFRAGDAPASPWFTIGTRPPPAFTGIQISVTPPAYTGRPPETVDARKDSVVIPEGSEVTLTATSNTPLESLVIQGVDSEPTVLASDKKALTWKGTLTVREGSALHLAATDTYGSPLEEELAFMLDPDRPPGIEVVSPGGRTVLPPGERPKINFQVSDDYGLTQVTLKEVPPDSDAKTEGNIQQSWPLDDADSFEDIWRSEDFSTRGADITFRIVARDNRPGQPNEFVSAPIVFSAPGHAEAAEQRNQLEQKGLAGLQRVIDLQKRNISQTKQQQQSLLGTTKELWIETTGRQSDIRSLTRDLLSNPVKPLGNLTETTRKLYLNEMVFAVDSLKAIPNAEPKAKEHHASEALAMQEKILRQLSSARTAASQAKIDRRLSGLASMLEALVRGQTGTLKQTQSFIDTKAEVSPILVDTQDALASDLTAFENTCDTEAAAVRGNDAAFADILLEIARQSGELKIRNEMVIAAERLDENIPTEALPSETRALAGLKALQAMLEGIKLEQEADQKGAMIEAVAQAKEKM